MPSETYCGNLLYKLVCLSYIMHKLLILKLKGELNLKHLCKFLLNWIAEASIDGAPSDFDKVTNCKLIAEKAHQNRKSLSS